MLAPAPSAREQPGREVGRRPRWQEWAATAGLIALCFVVYRLSPVRSVSDPYFAILGAECLLDRGSWDLSPHLAELERYAARRGEKLAAPADGSAESYSPGYSRRNYQLRRRGDALLYFYPPGVSLLAVPLVAVARLAGLSSIDEVGNFTFERELEMHAWLGALVAALGAGAVLRLARRELALGPALLLAVAAAFGTSLWSALSGALWSQTWSFLVLALGLLELLRWEDGERRRPVWLGLLMVAAFSLRPTNAVIAAVTAVFVAVRHRRSLAPLLATGAIGLATFLLWSWRVWGAPLPLYYRLGADPRWQEAPRALLGLLVAPSRGLLVFTPALLLVPLALRLGGVPPARRALLALVAAVVGVELLAYSTWMLWWGGGSYGPRLVADLLPLLIWTGALAMRSVSAAASAARIGPLLRGALASAGTVLALAGVVVHGAGAASRPIQRAVVRAGGERVWELGASPYAALWKQLRGGRSRGSA